MLHNNIEVILCTSNFNVQLLSFSIQIATDGKTLRSGNMRKFLNVFFKIAACLLLILCTVIMSVITYFNSIMPSNFNVIEGEDFDLPSLRAISGSGMLNYNKVSLANKQEGESETIQLKLYNLIPIKATHINVISEPGLTPGGTPFGIKLFTRGVMVIDINDVQTNGGVVNPARLAGIIKGDVILSIDSNEVSSNEQVADIIERSNGRSLPVTIKRDANIIKSILSPMESSIDGKYKSGIWVRDSSAGIGTVTYYIQNDYSFAGLGHGICDVDTGKIMPLDSGEVCKVSINSVLKGQVGTPGELRGSFASNDSIGTLMLNNEAGIYGVLEEAPNSLQPVKLRLKQKIKTGPAQIISTLDNTGPQQYNINIDKIDLNPKTMTKNMMITVTDATLLAKTGGIVQGMSGSPIIQDGELVGAVTHVFVNNPQKGYGIFAENMINFTSKLALCN